MRVVSVRYERKKQVEPYEPELIGLEIYPDEGDSATEAAERARNFVAAQFGELPDRVQLAEIRAQLEEVERINGLSFS
jgi:hypothetical protein